MNEFALCQESDKSYRGNDNPLVVSAGDCNELDYQFQAGISISPIEVLYALTLEIKNRTGNIISQLSPEEARGERLMWYDYGVCGQLPPEYTKVFDEAANAPKGSLSRVLASIACNECPSWVKAKCQETAFELDIKAFHKQPRMVVDTFTNGLTGHERRKYLRECGLMPRVKKPRKIKII